MATVVAVTDSARSDARTDNIVVVEPRRRRLLWIPRDLWCERLGDRVNGAFHLGQHRALISALGEHGINVKHSVCVIRAAVERALEDVVVSVPVPERLEFWYPLRPDAPIEDGRKVVTFSPPEEILRGERIHQWIGARYGRNAPGSDLGRIHRQQVFLRSLLEQGFPFAEVVAEPGSCSVSGDRAFNDLRKVRATWRFETYDQVVPRTIDGKAVLVYQPPPRPEGRLARDGRRLYRRLRRGVASRLRH